MKVEFDLDAPDDAIPGIAIAIAVFYDREGEAFFGLATNGQTAEAPQYIGILEMAKHRLLMGRHS